MKIQKEMLIGMVMMFSVSIVVADTDPFFVFRPNSKAKSSEINQNFNWLKKRVMPRGGIIMWSGSINSIPDGFRLCDGSNGTPDLTDRFILSVSSATEDPGQMGGTTAHTHRVSSSSAGAHYHLTSGGVNHENNVFVRSNPWGTESVGSGAEVFIWFDGVYENGGGSYQAYRTSTAGDHDHNFNMDSVSHRPPYFKLAFIMKI